MYYIRVKDKQFKLKNSNKTVNHPRTIEHSTIKSIINTISNAPTTTSKKCNGGMQDRYLVMDWTGIRDRGIKLTYIDFGPQIIL